MILPSQEECRRVMKELADDPSLTEWQSDFIESNMDRAHFTDRQREVIAEMKEEYQL